MLQRNITPHILEALADTPVVMLTGARQTGKSTLVRWLAAREHPARYLNFDDTAVLSAARHDPAGFLSGLEGPVILDEVQRVPDLFLAIKADVDRHRRPGTFPAHRFCQCPFFTRTFKFPGGQVGSPYPLAFFPGREGGNPGKFHRCGLQSEFAGFKRETNKPNRPFNKNSFTRRIS